MFANVNKSEGRFKDYKIPLKLRFDPKDGSRPIWTSREGSFDSIFTQEKYKRGAKASFGHFWHSAKRSVESRVRD